MLVPDHQGPRQAYAAGLMAGHAVLDSVRAAVRTPHLGLHHAAPTIVTGYSGGAIASGWAAQLAPKYALELNLVGAAFRRSARVFRAAAGDDERPQRRVGCLSRREPARRRPAARSGVSCTTARTRCGSRACCHLGRPR
ncbi:lipase family protein [Nocardia amikacinitolerans]|uniref:lipase family protein n=1 Tax=Nocardia amikacinitolerans TaxID=756689 RepID=UPI0020A2A498|nr:lipase family protein [Nocardia amikacinitolerans]